MVDLISPEIFLSLRRDKNFFYIDIFDLTKGGINIKLQA